MKKEIVVLFICTGNTCRSPMAEKIFKSIVREDRDIQFNVKSAGLYASDGDSMTYEAREVLKNIGLDFSHSATLISYELLSNCNYVVTMTLSHKIELMQLPILHYCTLNGNNPKIISAREVIGKDISDPYGCGMNAYKTSADEITKLCKEIYSLIKTENS